MEPKINIYKYWIYLFSINQYQIQYEDQVKININNNMIINIKL